MNCIQNDLEVNNKMLSTYTASALSIAMETLRAEGTYIVDRTLCRINVACNLFSRARFHTRATPYTGLGTAIGILWTLNTVR